MASGESIREIRRHHDVSAACGTCVQREPVLDGVLHDTEEPSVARWLAAFEDGGSLRDCQDDGDGISVCLSYRRQHLPCECGADSIWIDTALAGQPRTWDAVSRRIGKRFLRIRTPHESIPDLRPNSEFYVTYPFASVLQTRFSDANPYRAPDDRHVRQLLRMTTGCAERNDESAVSHRSSGFVSVCGVST